MSANLAMHPNHPPQDAMTLSFYAPDSALAHRLAARLHAHAQVQWIDSAQVTPLQLARSGQAGPLLLLDFSCEHVAASTALAQQLAELLPEGARVAVGSTSESASSVLAAMRAGLHDFIDIDAPAEDTHAQLRKVLGEARRSHNALAPIPARRARLVLVKGVRSGVGTSTLVAHLGVMAQQRFAAGDAAATTANAAQHVLLLDLGRPSGDLGLYLGAESHYHYEDLLHSAHRIDPTLVRTALTFEKHGTALVGQAVNSLQPPPAGNDASVLGERLRGLFDAILVDLGGLPDAHIPVALLRDADEIWLVTDPSIGALVSLDTALHELDRNGMRDARVKLVVNRHAEDAGISAVQISTRFELPLLATIPERLQALRNSASLGRLLLEDNPRDAYVRALAPLLDKLAPDARDDAARASLANRLGISRWTKK